MTDWKTYSIEQISESCLGKMLDRAKNRGEFRPYLANINVRWGSFDLSDLNQMRFESNEDERYGIRNGDLIICEGGEPGRCAIWREQMPEMKFQKALHRVRAREGFSNEFLFYRFLLAGRNGELEKHFNGSTIKHLTGASLKRIEFTFPPLGTQQRIAAVLSTLDTKIELNHRINAELEGMAKLLYDYWFVQYDFPLSAAQAAALGKPRLTGHPYRSSGGPMVFNPQLKREIPMGWKVGNLLDIATFTNGIACQKYPPTSDDFLPVIKIKEMRDGFTSSTERVTSDVPEKVIVHDGDVLFSWSASLEVMLWTGGTGALNQHIFKVTSEVFPRSYYYFTLQGYLAHFKMLADLRKTTMGHITRDHLEQSRIAIPPGETAENFETVTAAIFNQIINYHQQNQELARLREWLLPMLMNGQVTVGKS
jgi:type I restriction enzyme S subunit